MRHPTRREERGTPALEILRLKAEIGDEVADMVECHEHHHGAAHDVDRSDTRGTSFRRHGLGGMESGRRLLKRRGDVSHTTIIAPKLYTVQHALWGLASRFERADPETVEAAAAQRWTRRSMARVPLDLVTCGAMLTAFTVLARG